MKVNLGIWERLTQLVVLLLFGAGIFGVAVWYLPLIRQNESMRKEILRLNTEIKHQEEIARQLESSIRSLRTDPAAVEKLAREKLGYARPGETVIRFEEARTNSSGQPGL